MSHSLSLSNGDLTVINMDVPSLRPEWSMVRATEGPWPVKRYDKALVKEMVAKVIFSFLMFSDRKATERATTDRDKCVMNCKRKGNGDASGHGR